MFDYPDGATPFDPDAAIGLKVPVETREELDQVEQRNIHTGMIWLSGEKDSDILTTFFATTLHMKLFGDVWNWAGQVRNRELSIGIDPLQIREQLPQLIGMAGYWVEHDTYSPLEAATRFHHRLAQIHPFYNGNGRHARIYADALLEKVYGVPSIDWAKGANLQQDNVVRRAYIGALQAADAGNFGPLLDFTGDGYTA
ncbi:MAG: mobile mystery protein B [Sedimenticola sp.]